MAEDKKDELDEVLRLMTGLSMDETLDLFLNEDDAMLILLKKAREKREKDNPMHPSKMFGRPE